MKETLITGLLLLFVVLLAAHEADYWRSCLRDHGILHCLLEEP